MLKQFKENIDIQDRAINRVLITNAIAFMLGWGLYAIGTTVHQSIPPILFPIIGGFVSTYFLSDRLVKPLINEWVQTEIEQYKKGIEKDVLHFIQRPILDFLYTLTKQSRPLSNIDAEKLGITEEYSNPRTEMDKKIILHGKTRENHKQAEYELLEADKANLLERVSQTAVKKSLNITEADEKYWELLNNTYAYLRAWLVCSISHEKVMPIEPILDDFENTNNYIEIIRFIKTEILLAKNSSDFIPSQNSRDLIVDYLDKLMDLFIKNIKLK